MNHLFEGFDEAAYLEFNPGVYKAVQNGSFSSGLEHYIYHGHHENRSGVSSEVRNTMKNFIESFSPDDMPVPPEHLRKRAHGGAELKSFENVGRIISMNIYSSINSIIELNEDSRILDFGCGCGRVFRYFHKLSAKSKLYGTDIDKETISWCQHHLSQIGEFMVNQESTPLPFVDNFFDFIYSISVFTHLPEDMELAWLEELRRVTKPGGYLLLTTHGEKIFQSTSEDNKRQLQEKGFTYYLVSKTEGLPDFYQTSFHTENYIYNHWSRFFEIKKIIKNGIGKRQDLILCRKPS